MAKKKKIIKNKHDVDVDPAEIADLTSAGIPEEITDIEGDIPDEALDEIIAKDLAEPESSIENIDEEADLTKETGDNDDSTPTHTPIILKCKKCGEEVVEEPICPVCGTPLTLVNEISAKSIVNDNSDDPVEMFSTDEDMEEIPSIDPDDLRYSDNDMFEGLNTYDKELTDPYE